MSCLALFVLLAVIADEHLFKAIKEGETNKKTRLLERESGRSIILFFYVWKVI